VHSAGEIWANEVFECYVGVLTAPGEKFGEAQSRMQDYIIGGLKMTPADATYTEARDAILATAMAVSFEDYERCSRGFAKRGSGLRAVSPARSSSDLVGVVEDFTPFVCKGVGGPRGDDESPAPESTGVGSLGWMFLAPLLGALGLRRRRNARHNA
jgi:hypothetical protein